MKVHTIFGLVDREDLIVKDIIVETDIDRSLAMEWYLKRDLYGEIDGKVGPLEFVYPDGTVVRSMKGALVRRDASAAILRPPLIGAEQAALH